MCPYEFREGVSENGYIPPRILELLQIRNICYLKSYCSLLYRVVLKIENLT